MKLEVNDDYTLRGKTGLGRLDDETYLGWFIGYVENKSGVYFFAINLEGKNTRDMIPLRIELTKKALAVKGVITTSE